MVDLSAKPFTPRPGCHRLGARHHRLDDAGREDRAAVHQPQQRFHPEYLDEVLDKYHVGGMRYRSGRRRRDPGARPVCAVEVEGAAADRLEPGDGRFRQQQ